MFANLFSNLRFPREKSFLPVSPVESCRPVASLVRQNRTLDIGILAFLGVARGDFLTRARGQLALPLMPIISRSPEMYATVRIWLRYYEIYGIIILDIRCL